MPGDCGWWAHPKAKVYGAPLVASHVGADMAADMVAVDLETQRDPVMLVDIGTNTEVVVAHEGRMMTASCPAGPAFEGGGIRYGTTAVDGAIESLRLKDGQVDYSTIGGGEPIGLCGSALIDLLAELRRHERMTPKGVFADKSHEMTVVPHRDITFSREDGSNLAQAKAANYCGQYIVLRKFGLPALRYQQAVSGGWIRQLHQHSKRDRNRLPRACSGGSHRQDRQRLGARGQRTASVPEQERIHRKPRQKSRTRRAGDHSRFLRRFCGRVSVQTNAQGNRARWRLFTIMPVLAATSAEASAIISGRQRRCSCGRLDDPRQ